MLRKTVLLKSGALLRSPYVSEILNVDAKSLQYIQYSWSDIETLNPLLPVSCWKTLNPLLPVDILTTTFNCYLKVGRSLSPRMPIKYPDVDCVVKHHKGGTVLQYNDTYSFLFHNIQKIWQVRMLSRS
jgi:hypothetical protein